MSTPEDVANIRERLTRVWENPPVRDGKFGNALRSLTIQNIRGFVGTLEFQWPVTAIGGINGCGKTTVLQACSAAYVRTGTGRRHFTLGTWIGPALLGESPPVVDPGSVRYVFADSTPGFEVVYKAEQRRWGYPRRGNPEREVRFVGVGQYAPRIESRGRTHQNRARLNIESTETLREREVESIARILGSNYSGAALHTVGVSHAKWRDTVPRLERPGVAYTESHMGAGEQKVVRLVAELESLPERCLIVLEEPELTLHPDAQYGLAWYLMTLSLRRGHQVILATHSRMMFEALPRQARVLLTRDTGTLEVLHNVSHLDAAREMSSSVRSNQDLVFVEDDVARQLLTECLRRADPDLLHDASIISLGNDDDVRRMVTGLREQGVRAVGVRDADCGEDSEHALFRFPGVGCPEEELLTDKNLKAAETLIPGVGAAAMRAHSRGEGFSGSERAKRVLDALALEMREEPTIVADRLTLAWVNNNMDQVRELAEAVRAGLDSASSLS